MLAAAIKIVFANKSMKSFSHLGTEFYWISQNFEET